MVLSLLKFVAARLVHILSYHRDDEQLYRCLMKVYDAKVTVFTGKFQNLLQTYNEDKWEKTSLNKLPTSILANFQNLDQKYNEDKWKRHL